MLYLYFLYVYNYRALLFPCPFVLAPDIAFLFFLPLAIVPVLTLIRAFIIALTLALILALFVALILALFVALIFALASSLAYVLSIPISLSTNLDSEYYCCICTDVYIINLPP